MKTRTWLFVSIATLLVAGGAAMGMREAQAPVQEPAVVEAKDLYNATEKLFKRGRRDRKEVCITIDDGPHPQSVKEILDALKLYDAKATFFMVGQRIREHPEQVREVIRGGHEVGNHTHNHLRLDGLTPDQVRMEMALCAKNFEIATGGGKLHLFRPPGMRYTPEILKIAREFGYVTVDWNYGAKDFKPHRHDKIAEYVLNNVTNGGIILLHDNPLTAQALPEILRGLKARGFAIKTASEMLRELPEPVTVETNAGKLGQLPE